MARKLQFGAEARGLLLAGVDRLAGQSPDPGVPQLLGLGPSVG